MKETGHLEEDVAAFVGLGEPLAIEQHQSYERHLEGCAECQKAVRELRAIALAIETPPMTPSADFDQKLFARLDLIDREGRTEARREWWRSLFRPARLALALGPVAAGLLWFVSSRPRTPDGPSSDGAGPALAALDDLELGADLELYVDLDAAEYLDVAEDLEMLLAEAEESG